MAAPAVKVEGAKEFQRAMRRMAVPLNDLTKINRKAAQPVVDRARDLAPVSTGRLRRTIRSKASKNSARVLAGGVRGVVYAGPIHYGWPRRNIEPHPFLTDAIEDKRREVADIYETMVEDLVRRVEAETPG